MTYLTARAAHMLILSVLFGYLCSDPQVLAFRFTRNSGFRQVLRKFQVHHHPEHHETEVRILSSQTEEAAALDVKGAKAWIEAQNKNSDSITPRDSTASSNATVFAQLLSEKIRSIIHPELLDLQKSTNALVVDMRAELTAINEHSLILMKNLKEEVQAEQEEERKQLEARLETLSSALENLEWLSRRSFAAGDQAVGEVETFRRELDDLQSEVTELKETTDSMQRRVTRYEEELPVMRNELLEKLKELSSKADSIEDVEILKVRTLDGIARAENRSEEIQSHITDSLAQGNAMAEQLIALQSEVSDLKSELESQAQRSSTQVKDTNNKVESLSSDLKLEASDLRRAVESLTMDLDEGLERTDQRTRSAIGELRKRVQNLMSDFKKDFDNLRDQLGEVTQAVSQREAAILEELHSSTKDIRADIDSKFEEDSKVNAQKFLSVESKIDKEIARQGEVVAESIAQVMRTLQAENQRNKRELLTQMSSLERTMSRIEESIDDRIELMLRKRSFRARFSKLMVSAKSRCKGWFLRAKSWIKQFSQRMTRRNVASKQSYMM